MNIEEETQLRITLRTKFAKQLLKAATAEARHKASGSVLVYLSPDRLQLITDQAATLAEAVLAGGPSRISR